MPFTIKSRINSFLAVLIYLFAAVARASCLGVTENDFTSGEFVVNQIKSVSVTCEDDSNIPSRGNISKKAPGCALIVTRRGHALKGLNQDKDYVVYGGEGSCDFHKGKVFKADLKRNCCGSDEGGPLLCSEVTATDYSTERNCAWTISTNNKKLVEDIKASKSETNKNSKKSRQEQPL